MAIPASGSVSLSQIQTEWGGSAPTSISEYYLGSLGHQDQYWIFFQKNF